MGAKKPKQISSAPSIVVKQDEPTLMDPKHGIRLSVSPALHINTTTTSNQVLSNLPSNAVSINPPCSYLPGVSPVIGTTLITEPALVNPGIVSSQSYWRFLQRIFRA